MKGLGGSAQPLLQIPHQRRQTSEERVGGRGELDALGLVELVEMLDVPGTVGEQALSCTNVLSGQRAGRERDR